MSDPIFSEIDEEIRRERLQQFWNRHGGLLIAAAVVIVLAIAGWRGYQWWEARQAAQAGVAFEVAADLAEQDKYAEAEKAFTKLASEAPSGYRMLARMRAAAMLAQHDPQAAVKAYDALAADGSLSAEMRDLARLRGAMLLADTASYDQLRERLEPLTAPASTFRHTARELLAFSAWRAGNSDAVKRWIDMIVTDAETPASTRSRVEVLVALTGASAKS